MKSTKNKHFGIEKQDFTQLDTYDKLFREHNLIARMMRERILLLQHEMLKKLDPELAEKFAKEFVRVEIDWERKMLVVIPTDDPQMKAVEANELIERAKENNGKN